ncbi:MAG TPA: M20/M25/M40 family metallo-hydrolase [Pyrinomonadaceae bacterium]|jgi:acetylornithine deacetylase|nr:M20/M25/M40 family metallo-hydrolase [Pyrinomonadaceae bacterium]
MNLIELTRHLIDIPSVTGEEAAVGRFLSSYLESLGYRVEAQEVASALGGRVNIIATTGEPPRVVLSTHMDTVPPHIPSREDDEQIYGRGACDAKGIIAAQVVAAEQLRADGFNEFGLLFTVDEEAGSDGARLANEHPLAASCRYLINGEPTDNQLALGSKGSLRLRIHAKGRAAHSAYPEHGDSAIEKLLDALALIRQCSWPTDEFFGETICNIGTIQGGTRANVIPAEAYSDLQIRLVTPAARIKEILEGAIKGRARVEYLSQAEPVRLLAVERFASCIVRFTTDIPYLTKWGAPLLLGPGSILDAHTDYERVSKRELNEAVELYVRLVRILLARVKGEARHVENEGAIER